MPAEPPLSREDAARWHMGTPRNPMVIGALLLFKQRLTLEALDQVVLEKITPHRRFRQHVAEAAHPFGRPRWRDDARFDVREHVQKLEPSWADDAALDQLVSERMNVPLPRDRSPWRLELVDVGPSGSALLVRIHHCIADGRALVALLQELADAPGVPGEKAARSPAPPSRQARPESFFGRLVGLFRLLAPLGAQARLLHRPLSGRKRLAWSAAIPLEDVKAIARAGGHRFVDVVLAAVAGALDRYHRDHGQAPPFLRVLLPVAGPTRASARALGNHFASVFVRLPLASTDPKARLETIAREVAALQGGRALRVALGLVRLAGAIAPAIEHWAVRWWSKRASLVVSSLAGPPSPVRLAGQTLQSIIVWSPTVASVGLSLTFFGYAGKLHLGVLADDALIDRPEDLVTAFQAALEDLRRSSPADNG